MQETYEAILRADHLEWSGEDRPDLSSHGRPVVVRVTILGEAAPVGDGRLMAEALERLSAMQALPGLTDPAAWEREVRRERPLPETNMNTDMPTWVNTLNRYARFTLDR